MKIALVAAAVALVLPLGAAVHAQSSPGTVKKSAATVKHAASAKAKAGKKTKTAKAAKGKAAPAQPADAPLSEAQLALARNIQTGAIQCELGATVTVTADDKTAGFFNIALGKARYHMHPVESRTGAIRLEDERAGAVWLQLGNKSMLMNQQQGRRMADECATPQQREFALQLKDHPQPNLLDRPSASSQPNAEKPSSQNSTL